MIFVLKNDSNILRNGQGEQPQPSSSLYASQSRSSGPGDRGDRPPQVTRSTGIPTFQEYREQRQRSAAEAANQMRTASSSQDAQQQQRNRVQTNADLHKSMIVDTPKERMVVDYEQKQVEFYTAQDASKPQSKTLPRRGKSDYLSDYHDMAGLGGNSSSGGPVGAVAAASSSTAPPSAGFGQVSLFEEKNEFLWECDHPKPGLLSSILDKVGDL